MLTVGGPVAALDNVTKRIEGIAVAVPSFIEGLRQQHRGPASSLWRQALVINALTFEKPAGGFAELATSGNQVATLEGIASLKQHRPGETNGDDLTETVDKSQNHDWSLSSKFDD